MHDLQHRFAVAVLLVVGAVTALSPLAGGQISFASLADAPALPLVWHRQLLLVLLGIGLVLAAFVPALRLAVIGAAILSKAGFLAIFLSVGGTLQAPQWLEAGMLALLLGAAMAFALEAWKQARWDGMLPLRLEA